MMGDSEKMHDLARITGAIFDTAMAQMAVLTRREATLRENLGKLGDSRKAQSLLHRETGDPALLAGADLRWHRWIDHRRAILNTELAQVLALKAAKQEALKTSFGRHQAMLALGQKADAQQARVVRRRADYES